MGDGRKWAAEREQEEAEEQAAAFALKRAGEFSTLMIDIEKAKEHLRSLDAIKRCLQDLDLANVPMTRGKQQAATRLEKLLMSLP